MGHTSPARRIVKLAVEPTAFGLNESTVSMNEHDLLTEQEDEVRDSVPVQCHNERAAEVSVLLVAQPHCVAHKNCEGLFRSIQNRARKWTDLSRLTEQ